MREREQRRQSWIISVQWTYYKWREVRLTRLLNEGGVWGCPCTVWRIDNTEGPFGVRTRLVPHYTAPLLYKHSRLKSNCTVLVSFISHLSSHTHTHCP
jgi:hypothetical protein